MSMSVLASICLCTFSCFFFFNDTATTEIYTLSLHDALPIFVRVRASRHARRGQREGRHPPDGLGRDRRSEGTRLNSSHVKSSYAVFCLKKKKKKNPAHRPQRGKTKKTTTEDKDQPS